MSEHQIKLPQTVNLDSLENAVCAFWDELRHPADRLVWDMSQVRFVNTAGLVMLAAMSNQARTVQEVSFYFSETNSKNQDVKNYMERMDFFRVCGDPYRSERRRFDQTAALCEITTVQDESEINKPIIKLRNIIRAQRNMSGLETVISELVMNTIHHAHADFPCFIAAQVFRELNQVQITICDNGIGIRQSLANAGMPVASDTKAIRLALEQYISGNLCGERSNSGLGLFYSKNIFERNRGNFCIWSGSGIYHLSGGEEYEWDGHTPWRGTIVDMCYNLNNYVDITRMYTELSAADACDDFYDFGDIFD